MLPTVDPGLVEKISQRFEIVKAQVYRSAEKVGRNPAEVRIVAVSKKHSVEVIAAAYQVGLRNFGENYAEEAVEKIAALKALDGIEWEMIGHIQSRKAKLIANNFKRVHSLDSEKLARLLSQLHPPGSEPLQVMLEINISGEPSKGGLPGSTQAEREALLPFVTNVTGLAGLHLIGLMTMPPLTDDASQNRQYFAKLRDLKDYLNQNISNLDLQDLSMGTSMDYPVAVEEGATFLRIGEALLGPRIYV